MNKATNLQLNNLQYWKIMYYNYLINTNQGDHQDALLLSHQATYYIYNDTNAVIYLEEITFYYTAINGKIIDGTEIAFELVK